MTATSKTILHITHEISASMDCIVANFDLHSSGGKMVGHGCTSTHKLTTEAMTGGKFQ